MPKTAYANASSAVALSFAAIFFTDQVSHEVFFAVFHHFSPIKQATSIPYTSLLKSHINTVHLGFFFVNDDVINDGSGVTRNLDFWLLVDVSS